MFHSRGVRLPHWVYLYYMDTIEITYKDKTYVVYNPGELLLDDRGYLIDQLNKSLPKMGRYRSSI